MSRYKQRVNDRLRDTVGVRKLTDKEIEKIHQLYLDMLEDFFSFCKDNDIYVTLAGGSVLGAVRHHGFIPWDDDVDLHISREGMEKLKEVFSRWNNGRYLLHAPNYLSGSKVRMGQIENTQVVIEDYTGHVHGLVIDLFVLENIPDNLLVRLLCGIRSSIYTAISGYVVDYVFFREDREKHPNTRAYLSWEQRIRIMLGKCFSFRTVENWINILDNINQYKSEFTEYVGSPTGMKHYFGEIYKREAMLRMEHMLFEEHLFPIPLGYDSYLQSLYGDYMKLPPEEKRQYHYIRNISFNLKK